VDFVLRKATLEDRPAISILIAESVRGLSRDDYSDEQIESAIKTAVFGVDTVLITDGTYFVAEVDDQLIGCGGWSKRKTLFGGDQFTERAPEELDPRHEPAKIRAFFVHPQWARRGVGKTLLTRCESDARAHGFTSLEMMATLPGMKMYQAFGYMVGKQVIYKMTDGVTIELVRMNKQIPSP
jgi:GNAT superfamily N-acetyltransferase